MMNILRIIVLGALLVVLIKLIKKTDKYYWFKRDVVQKYKWFKHLCRNLHSLSRTQLPQNIGGFNEEKKKASRTD